MHARPTPADLIRYDCPCGESVGARDEPSEQLSGVLAQLHAINDQVRGKLMLRRIKLVNQLLEQTDWVDARTPEERGLTVEPVGPLGHKKHGLVVGEWIRSATSDPDRTLLYVHGGGFVGGSLLSHRIVTQTLAERTGLSVFSADYRVWPRSRRQRGIADVRAAYDYVLAHGPGGLQKSPEQIVVAGDSAGGNLTLMLLQWARDTKRRPVDAAIAMSPVTDVALNSPSAQRDFNRDVLLGQFFEWIHRVPSWPRGVSTNLFHGAHREDPTISPLFGDLSDLPPTLVQSSDDELLTDDSNRYVNRAREAGSPVEYQTWRGMPHVFQLFSPLLPEADEAYEQMTAFLDRVLANEPAPIA